MSQDEEEVLRKLFEQTKAMLFIFLPYKIEMVYLISLS